MQTESVRLNNTIMATPTAVMMEAARKRLSTDRRVRREVRSWNNPLLRTPSMILEAIEARATTRDLQDARDAVVAALLVGEGSALAREFVVVGMRSYAYAFASTHRERTYWSSDEVLGMAVSQLNHLVANTTVVPSYSLTWKLVRGLGRDARIAITSTPVDQPDDFADSDLRCADGCERLGKLLHDGSAQLIGAAAPTSLIDDFGPPNDMEALIKWICDVADVEYEDASLLVQTRVGGTSMEEFGTEHRSTLWRRSTRTAEALRMAVAV